MKKSWGKYHSQWDEKIKYIWLSLPTEVKDLNGENFNIPKKEINMKKEAEDRNKYYPNRLAEIILSGYIAKGNMHVECNPYKDLNKILYKSRK